MLRFKGARLKGLRKAAGLSRAALAQAAGVSEGMIYQYETGKFAPGVEVAARLAAAVGCAMSDFMEEGND